MINNLRILIISPAWLGDFVMMQSMLKQLKRDYPKSAIDVVAPKVCLPLAQFMPEINNAIDFNTTHGKLSWSARKKLGKSLINKYDWAITLPITWKSALVPFFAKIPKRTGFFGEVRWGLLNDIIKLDKTKTPLMVDRYLSLLNLEYIIKSKLYPSFKIDITTENSIALCPGASYGPAKKWPVEYFKELAHNLVDKGFKILIFGSEEEKQDGNYIIKDLEKTTCVNYAGALNLTDSVKKLATVKTIITNDSGLMHIGCALNKKTIAIFGSSTPKHTPPLSENATILETSLSCRPCFQKTCKYGHYNCLKNITVQEVIDSLNNKKIKKIA